MAASILEAVSVAMLEAVSATIAAIFVAVSTAMLRAVSTTFGAAFGMIAFIFEAVSTLIFVAVRASNVAVETDTVLETLSATFVAIFGAVSALIFVAVSASSLVAVSNTSLRGMGKSKRISKASACGTVLFIHIVLVRCFELRNLMVKSEDDSMWEVRHR